MSEYSITINKSVDFIDDPIQSVRLRLTVVSTEGINAAIFVHRFFPKSPYSGTEEYEFYNVAYPDEFSSISDKISNPRQACYIRTTKVDKTFKDMSQLTEFFDIVMADIRRLISYYDTFDAVKDTASEVIKIDVNGVTSRPASDIIETARIVNQNVVSTDGGAKLNQEESTIIIVDITGKQK